MWSWERLSYSDAGVAFDFNPEQNYLLSANVEGGKAVAWFTSSRIGAWELAGPVRPLLARLLAARDLTLLHAGAIGRNGAALLLPAPGGSGKSTSVALALRRGFDSVGDDFLIALPDSPPSIANLYRTMRLAPSSPMFDVARHQVVPDGFGNEKALAYIDAEYPGQLVERQRVVAMATPVITGESQTRVVPASRAEILRALLPSSLFYAANREAAAMTALTNMVRSLPAYRLELGTDLDGVISAIESLLAKHGSRV
jgi:hypothetical protein